MRHASWIVLLSLMTTSGFAQEKTFEPGLYEVVTKAGKGPAPTTRVCLDAKDIVKGLSPEVDKNCKRDRSVVAGGKPDFATTCPDTTMTMTGVHVDELRDGRQGPAEGQRRRRPDDDRVAHHGDAGRRKLQRLNGATVEEGHGDYQPLSHRRNDPASP